MQRLAIAVCNGAFGLAGPAAAQASNLRIAADHAQVPAPAPAPASMPAN